MSFIRLGSVVTLPIEIIEICGCLNNLLSSIQLKLYVDSMPSAEAFLLLFFCEILKSEMFFCEISSMYGEFRGKY